MEMLWRRANGVELLHFRVQVLRRSSFWDNSEVHPFVKELPWSSSCLYFNEIFREFAMESQRARIEESLLGSGVL